MRVWSMLGLAVVGMLARVPSAKACTCGEGTVAASIAAAEVLFEGVPSSVEDVGLSWRFRFEVTRYFKGQLGPTVDIHTRKEGVTCGRYFEVGTFYLVYPRENRNGFLIDGLCSRTRGIAAASEDLALLGPGVEPDPTFTRAGPGSAIEEGSGCAVFARRQPRGAHWLALLLVSLGLFRRRSS